MVLFWGLALVLAAAAGLWMIRPLIARRVPSDGAVSTDDRPRRLALAVLAAVPLAALGLYLLVGRPDLANDAVMKAQREMRDYVTLVAELERRVAQRPDDPEGHRLLALSQAELGRYGDATKNYERAIALGVKTAEIFASYGEALTLLHNNVTPEAMDAFDQALALDPKNQQALYYRASGFFAAGDAARAVADWKRLAALVPAGSPLADAINRNVALAEKMPSPSNGGLTDLPAEQQRAAIEAMVARLAARLDAESPAGPHDLEGWVRLVQSYEVLGETDKANAARAEAKALFAQDAAALARLDGH